MPASSRWHAVALFILTPLAALAVGGHGLGMLLTLIAWATGFTMFPTKWDPRWSYRGRDNTFADRDAAVDSLRSDPTNDQWAKTMFPQVEREVNFDDEAVEIIYSGSCYTPSNLASMTQLENTLFADAAYQSSMCWKADRGGQACRKPKSPLRLFDGTFEDLWPVEDVTGARIFRADPTFSRIAEITLYAWKMDGDSTDPAIVNAGNPDALKYSHYITGRGAGLASVYFSQPPCSPPLPRSFYRWPARAGAELPQHVLHGIPACRLRKRSGGRGHAD